MGAEDLLEEDARADWIERGFALKDFSMKKMTQIWDEEEREERAREKKKKIIAHKHVPISANVQKVLSKVSGSVAQSSSAVFESLASYEPTILRNRRWLREHVALIHQMDEESMRYKRLKLQSHTQYRKAAKEIAEKEEDRHARIEHKAPLLRRLREMKTAADKRDRAYENEQLEIKWKYWRDLQSQEKEAYESQVETLNAAQVAHKRSMNMQYWRAKLIQSRKSSAIATEALDAKMRAEAAANVNHVLEEIALADGEPDRWDSLDMERSVTMNGLGVFGIPVDPGDFESLEDGGFQPELDEHTIAFPTAGPFDMSHEEVRIALQDATSKLRAAQEKQWALDRDYDVTRQDHATMTEKETEMLKLLSQIKADHDDLLEVLAGPPRREPGDLERSQIHAWMELKQSLESRLEDVRARMRLATTQLSRLRDHLEAVQADIREHEAHSDALQSTVDGFDGVANDLPMVIGRSIGQLPDTAPMLPQALLARISHRTRFELIKAAAEPAFQVYEEARALGLESWKISKQKMLDEGELEAALHRLATIKDKLLSQQSLNQRADVVNAVEKFHAKHQSLHRVQKISTGDLEWWKQRDEDNSLGVSLSPLGDTILLDAPLRRGILRGACLLPSHSLWQLHFKIRILSTASPASFTHEDKVKVSFGTTTAEQTQAGVYSVVNDHGELHDCHNLVIAFVGTRLCYSIEYWKGPRSPAHALGLEAVGRFTEDVTAQVDLYSTKHVLSEYVKMLRIQSHQGNHRIAALLEELIAVDASREELWDSKVLHGHTQRFLRTNYAAQLRASIQAEVSKSMDKDIRKRREAYEQAVQSQIRLEASMLEYRHRKSEYIEAATAAARKLLGSPLEIVLDESWCRGIIMNMRVEWREGGTKLSFLHQVLLASATSLWLDLSTVKYVLVVNEMDAVVAQSRAHEVEEEVHLAQQRQVALQMETTKSLLELEREYLVIMNQEDAAFEDAKGRDLLRREKALQQEATRVCHYDPQVKSLLELEAHRLCRRVDVHESFDATLRLLQLNYVKETVQSRMQFIHKTWIRKNTRRLEKRKLERRARKIKYDQSMAAKREIIANEVPEVALSKTEVSSSNNGHYPVILRIPNFEKAVAPGPACTHAHVKSWGSLYGQGIRCKDCGREVAHLENEGSDGARGPDPALDRDVERHRENEASFRFTSAAQLARVEAERLRLEKERREMEVLETRGYDTVHSKAITELNFRHGIDRENAALVATRNREDRHAASYRDEISFYARINQFRYRLGLILKLRSDLYEARLLELEMITSLHMDRERTDGTIAIVQIEQEAARELLRRRRDAIAQYAASTEDLKACLIEKQLAIQARQGVEEDAKFAMLHALALDRTSATMRRLFLQAQDERGRVRDAVRDAKEARDAAVIFRRTLADRLLALFYRQKGTKVHTIYGVGHVLYYRDADAVVAVKLEAWKATVFQPLELFVHADKAKQQAEALHMATAEAEMRAFVVAERAWNAMELALMREEEAQCQTIVAWAMLSVAQNARMDEALSQCELRVQFQLQTKAAKVEMAAAASAEATKAHTSKIKIVKSVWQPIRKPPRKPIFARSKPALAGAKPVVAIAMPDGNLAPPSKPIKQSKFDHARLTRACQKRIYMDKVEQALLRSRATLAAQFDAERERDLRAQVQTEYLYGFLADLLAEIAAETIAEGEASTRELEITSNVVFSVPHPHLQVHIYRALLRQMQGHTLQLQVMQRSWARQIQRLRCVQAEVARRKALSAAIEAERKRIESLCKEMAREEVFCRRFYREEKRLMLLESRAMQLAENEMREYIRQVELQKMLAQFDALGADANKNMSSKEARRLEIKMNKREIKRLAIEWALIKKEDELALALREVFLKEERDALYEQQQLDFMLEQAAFQDSDNDDDDDDAPNVVVDAHTLVEHSTEVASGAPQTRDELKQAKRREKRREVQRLAAMKKAEFAHQLNEEYMIAAAETFHSVATAELRVMETTQTLHALQRRSMDLVQVGAMEADMRRCLQLAQQVMAGALQKKAFAETCIARCVAAEAALERAIVKEKADNIFMIKTVRETAFMDSAVLHKRVQRFRTEYLAGQLYTRYFELLVDLVLYRTMAVSAERNLFRLTDEIERLDTESATKSAQVAALWRKHNRSARLRLLRSELGRRFFRKERQRALQRAFQGWVKVWTHALVVRNSYDLRYALLRQEGQLRKLEVTEATEVPAPDTKVLPRETTTTLRKFQHRWITCRLCKTRYSDAQNNRFACVYHPGTYEVACVKSCGTRKGGPIQSNCMLHRAKRWLCCDQTIEGAFGSTGCKRRFHLPTRDDPTIAATVADAEVVEKRNLEAVTSELVALQQANVSGKVYSAFRDQLGTIEASLVAARAKVVEFDAFHKR
ncbi:hypothetical protein SPRG_15231 [Saprolegnia parasitica CBS 223.65]|uniref:Uncharacterized protein n=1 Tax=Saprolegnia parasitica (strain CBS 223.65) TaxID=695850 RepID=A0A067BXK5_SAPPC|nr:hypothetical protein SPRG_15231 [Saprolegnia parasitica CBS 223.65]KDO19292.1 hypothetical protein SPRG_15231 [Saprolegnia parasitica CBS 223.65]|eukprot:XP_012210003.1 hypothetical protein SPRG_15231 [Saprolegnia parasitica CBS 223.65]